MELDIKGFVYDQSAKTIKNWNETKEKILEIDLKAFSLGFSKYEKAPEFNEISKRLFMKKKNKKQSIFYNC